MRSIVLGFDAFAPTIFEDLCQRGRMPHLGKLAESDGYSHLKVANPPQSEVSWTSLATGLNPGGHGIFDLVHRDPATYRLYPSLLPTRKGPFGYQFVRPHNAPTIFEHVVGHGYPATSLWWPATFPARYNSPVRSIPGFGTPDIMGRLGAGTFCAPASMLPTGDHKTRLLPLQRTDRRTYSGRLMGPLRKSGSLSESTSVKFELEFAGEYPARLKIGKTEVQLNAGEWSTVLTIVFPIRIGVSVRALTRAVLNERDGEPALYFLPLQIDPRRPLWPYASPPSLAKRIWRTHGPFLTLGWPQDTTGLEEGFTSNAQFMQLCHDTHAIRERVFFSEVHGQDEGVIAGVFDSLDRVQHMFWKNRTDVIEEWYEKLDAMFGRLLDEVGRRGDPGDRIVVVSDHGMAPFDYKVHLNRWLIKRGHMTPVTSEPTGSLADVDWRRTVAYAAGLNGVYINVADREGQGTVRREKVPGIEASLRDDLLRWRGPDGRPVVSNACTREEAFVGPFAERGPDIVVGYNSGYRASAQTGLGKWQGPVIEPNRDRWSSDHCIDPNHVPGVVFASTGLTCTGTFSYHDFPELVWGEIPSGLERPPPEASTGSEEEQDILEERLADLGYL